MLKTAYQIISDSNIGEDFLQKLQKYEVNQLRLIKADVNEIIEVTSFMAGSVQNDDPCLAESTETFDIQLYHNGEGEFPEVGDTIYTDESATIPRTVAFAYFDGLSSNGVQVDENGVSQAYTCR